MFDAIFHRGGNDDSNRELVGAIYARVSTKAQNKEGISLDDQVKHALAYAQKEGIRIPPGFIFRDTYSGLKDDRPEYGKIRKLIYDQKIDVLIIYSADRHTRETIHGAIFREELRRSRVQLHNVSRGGEVDIYTADGEFFNTIEDAFNKRWAMMIQKTTQEKKRAYSEAGIPLQQGIAKFGYTRVGKQMNARLVFIEEEIQIVRDIYNWFDGGIGVGQIQKRLEGIATPNDRRRTGGKKAGFGLWNRSTIYKILLDEIYAGVYYPNRYGYGPNGKLIFRPREEWGKPIDVPAAISREQWERVQRRLADVRTEGMRPAKYEYLLNRLTKCGQCGYSVNGKRSTPHHYYACSSSDGKRVGKTCGMPYFRVPEVDAAVWEFTVELLSNPRAVASAMRRSQEEQRKHNAHIYHELETIDRLIAEAEEAMRLAYADYKQARSRKLLSMIEQDISSLEEKANGLKQQRERVAKEVAEQVITDEEIRSIERYTLEVKDRLPHATFVDKRTIVERLKFRFVIALEGKEKVVYIHWYTHQFKVDLTGGMYTSW
jgi:site-specific DNA recombinase